MAEEEKPGPDDSSSPESLLDTLLHNLYDFGETLDKKTLKRSKNKKKRDSVTAEALTVDTVLQPESLSRGQKKSSSSFFKKLQEELLCDSSEGSPGPASHLEVSEKIFPAPLLTKGQKEPVEVVEFHSWKKKKKTEQEPPKDDDTKKKTNDLEKGTGMQEFNLEKARLEVHRFGITGYGKGKERILERERAIMLGAKPPKNNYVNYKVLQEQIKEKKVAKEEKKRMAQVTDTLRKKRKGTEDNRKSKKKKLAPSILSAGSGGQIGKFKNGTLILSSVDIKKINSSKVTK